MPEIWHRDCSSNVVLNCLLCLARGGAVSVMGLIFLVVTAPQNGITLTILAVNVHADSHSVDE